MTDVQETQTLATVRRAACLTDAEWPDERIRTVRAFAASAAKNIHHLVAFLSICQRYGLDPVVGQVYLIDTDAGPKVFTGRDGWLAIARREPGYRGTQFGAVCAEDEFSVKRCANGSVAVTHRVRSVAARGALVGAYAVVRDERYGYNYEVRAMNDFAHLLRRPVWQRNPTDMVLNRCIAAVLRKTYGYAGLYVTGEEDEFTPATRADATAARMEDATEPLRARLAALRTPAPDPAPDPTPTASATTATPPTDAHVATVRALARAVEQHGTTDVLDDDEQAMLREYIETHQTTIAALAAEEKTP